MAAPLHRGLRHLALRVTDIRRARAFYEQVLDMKVVWEPDPENVYFSSGCDNLALHQLGPTERASPVPTPAQPLDHFGIILDSPQAVDRLYGRVQERLAEFGTTIVKPPKPHRDGSYSFYFSDPDGNVIQALFEPTISKLRMVKGDE
jgi:catechol 2,3-dioxygenase-like lactoylglutathione lyase family enzyme